MASTPQVFDFVLGRERSLVPPGLPRALDRSSAPGSRPTPAADRLVRLDAAGRRLVEDHLQLLATCRRHQGRDAA